ncbi:hypothetical protein LIER_31682 [Lithospermum erythrorhizon]|uniref:Pentatricopeptide repeat-containing protein n=1 Tax=Lithospermum erythrorhizon TaxID=34254 RepID=A0AAV3RTX5_LITER
MRSSYVHKFSHLSTLFFNGNGTNLKKHLFSIQVKAISTSSTSPAPTVDHIAHLILEQRSPNQTLQTFRWASRLPNFTHTQSTYRALIHKLCTFRRFDIVCLLLDEMPTSIGMPPDDDIFVTYVRGLSRARKVREVTNVLELVSEFGKEPSLKLFNTILDVLVKEDIDIAREFYRKKMKGNGDDYTYSILMKGLCITNRIGDGFKLLQTMKTQGITPCIVAYNTLINGLCKNGKVGRARSLLSEVENPNDVTFNIFISTYCKEGDLVQALVMLEKSYSNGFVPDVISVTKVVDLLCEKGRVTEAVEVIERAESRGGKIDIVAYNTLIKGFCRIQKVKVARHVMVEMEMKGCLPNMDTYNSLISGLCDSGMLELALEMFDEMKRVGIGWNFTTYDTLIYGLFSRGRMKEGFKILELLEDSKEGSGGRVRPYNSMLYGLYKENNISKALAYLTKMEKMFPRVVDRTLRILSLCDKKDILEAKKVYDLMIQEGDGPSALVYANLIPGLCQIDSIKEAFELFNEMLVRSYLPVPSTSSSLVSGLCRQGKVDRALKFLEDITGRGCLLDAENFSPIIIAFCNGGEFHNALMVFLQMVESGIVPNHSSWNALVQQLSQETRWSGGNSTYHLHGICN